MLKVIIVEDEEKICNMIATFIDWNKMGFHVIGTAKDGLTGKELIKREQPDVVITDIRMPGCDGIEMIESIKTEYPDMDIIIISGHKNFEYAHKAIKFGIRYFLLKPIMESELEEILIEICERHRKELNQQSEMRYMQARINTQNDILRNNFLMDLCDEKNHFSNTMLPEINSKYAAGFATARFCVLLARCNKKYSNDISGSENALMNILPLVERTYGDLTEELIYGINDYGLVIVLNYREMERNSIKERHAVFYKNAAQRIRALGMYLFYIGVGHEVSMIQHLHRSFFSALLAIRNRVFVKEEGLLSYNGNFSEQEDTLSIVSYDSYSQLLEAIKKQNEAGMEQWFLELHTRLREIPSLNLSQLYSICMQVFDYVERLIEKNCRDTIDRIHVLQELKIALLEANTLNGVVRALREQVNALARHYFNDESSGQNQHIRKAIAYIQENYGSPLKLEDVAKHVYLNPTYFSEIFKMECKVNFSDYLLDIRIENAKKMLRETDLSVAQIAAKVGYSDAKYFSKIFTKVVGIKPTGYRKLYV